MPGYGQPASRQAATEVCAQIAGWRVGKFSLRHSPLCCFGLCFLLDLHSCSLSWFLCWVKFLCCQWSPTVLWDSADGISARKHSTSFAMANVNDVSFVADFNQGHARERLRLQALESSHVYRLPYVMGAPAILLSQSHPLLLLKCPCLVRNVHLHELILVKLV